MLDHGRHGRESQQSKEIDRLHTRVEELEDHLDAKTDDFLNLQKDMAILNEKYVEPTRRRILSPSEVTCCSVDPVTAAARVLAESARLGPYWTTVAVELERHYNTVKWWADVHAALRAGQLARTVRQVGTTPLTRDAADVIGRIIESIDGQNLQRNVVSGLNNGFEFVEHCDLGHIGFLIGKHWTVFSPLFVRGTRPLPLTSG